MNNNNERNKIILLKYGELWLKSDKTKHRFLDALKWHLEKLFPEDKFIFKRDRIEVSTSNYNLKRFKYVPGIELAQIAYKTTSDIQEIKENSLFLIKKEHLEFQSFAVRCKRAGKHNFSSKDIEIEIGSEIKEKLNKKVNLTNPDFTLKIEIINEWSYLIYDSIECIGGLPYASEGVCNINNPNNWYLSIEILKRGLYIKNLHPELQKIYPEKKTKEQYFTVEVYDDTIENLDKIRKNPKNEILKLYPLITLNKREVLQKNEEIKEKIKNYINIFISK